MLDPVVSLAFIAAHTRTVRLATGILLIPQLNPLVVAKELASLDVLSGGRLIFGIGVGWSEHEYEVLGVPYRDRGGAKTIIWKQSRRSGRKADRYTRANSFRSAISNQILVHCSNPILQSLLGETRQGHSGVPLKRGTAGLGTD